MKPRCLKKPVRLSLAKGTRREGIMLCSERFIGKIIDLFMAEGHLAEYYDHVLMNHMTQHVWIKTLSANYIN